VDAHMLAYFLFLILASGTCLAIPSFTGHRFSADDFSHGSRDIVVASVASHSFRINNLRRLVESIEGQVNRLNVFLLEYTAIPPFLSNNWVTVHLATKRQEAWGEWTRLFWADGLHEDTGGCYHFLLDENLIYPKNYVSFTVEQIENYGRNIIVGMHGRRFTQGTYFGEQFLARISKSFFHKDFQHYWLHRSFFTLMIMWLRILQCTCSPPRPLRIIPQCGLNWQCMISCLRLRLEAKQT